MLLVQNYVSFAISMAAILFPVSSSLAFLVRIKARRQNGCFLLASKFQKTRSGFGSRKFDLSSVKRSGSESSTVATEAESIDVIHHSGFLGDIYKIQIGDKDDFLGVNAVPTFASERNLHNRTLQQPSLDHAKARGLEGALGQGPAFVLDNVLSPEVCEDIIQSCETVGFGSYKAGKNFHGAMQFIVPPRVADVVSERLGRHIDVDEVIARRREMMLSQHQDDSHTHDVRLIYAGLNRRWRVYRYAPGGEETFAPHIDAGFPPSGLTEDGSDLIWDDSPLVGDFVEVVSRLTVLMYLNDDFQGGETKFYEPNITAASTTPTAVIASVKPVAGSVLVFPQGVGEEAVGYARQNWPLHEGSPVISGSRPKYVIRSDVIFTSVKEKLPLDDVLFQNDHLVRQTFLPRIPVADQNFLSHALLLYNPHMGVENMGPLLYSIVRFTKKRKIVEIGAGYTSVWILQALKDNDDELKRIQNLSRQGKCKLLNTQWTNTAEVDDSLETSSSLFCIDNCEHQKETATGACAVAKSLGLDSYLKFLKRDAFEMSDIFGEKSVEMLWCDFGVGSRMKEFVSSGAWASLKPGGLLLCHSTLTNQRTRDWLEAARSQKGEAVTGIPVGEYVEISFLEPHKHYQNSVSIFQKRKTHSEAYVEPIYSEYA